MPWKVALTKIFVGFLVAIWSTNNIGLTDDTFYINTSSSKCQNVWTWISFLFKNLYLLTHAQTYVRTVNEWKNFFFFEKRNLELLRVTSSSCQKWKLFLNKFVFCRNYTFWTILSIVIKKLFEILVFHRWRNIKDKNHKNSESNESSC